MKFETLVERLHINPVVLSEIKNWEDDTELSKLLKTFRSAKNQESFLDHYAEVIVARHFISRKCKLEVEVQTPKGKRADLRVTKDNYSFCVHIKRLNLEQVIEKELRAISRLGHLRRISKPVNLNVSLSDRLKDEEIQEVDRQSESFIQNSQIGDKRDIVSSGGKILAKCEILPKFKDKGKNVGINISPKLWAPIGRKRFYKKLSDAYKQFMPESLNVILVTSRLEDDFDDFEKSLLDSSGFWSNKNHLDSYMVGWFTFGTEVDDINFRIRYRDRYKIPVGIRNIFR